MIRWEQLADNGEGNMIYQRIDEDGKIRVTAVKGYPELDEYLALQDWLAEGKKESDFWALRKVI